MEIQIKKSTVRILLGGILLFVLAVFVVTNTSMGAIFTPSQLENGNLLAVFLTGLVTGGLTCLAVQGGLLAATIAQREEQKLTEKTKSGNALPIFAFLSAKLVAYTILGFLLGWLGSVVQLSLTAKVIMQFAVAIFMIGTALHILNVHPIFRYFVIQPPRFLTRLVRKQSKKTDVFAPALLGAFTVFIPCGTTQAMMALAIASGNPFMGAAILFAFVLGTSPLFFALGYFATKLGDALHQKFMKFAAVVLILLAVYSIDGALELSGSSFTVSNMLSMLSAPSKAQDDKQVVSNEPTITIEDTGYSPSSLSVKAGSQVILHIVNTGGRGCTQAFTIPTYGIQKVVPLGGSDTVQFTAPDKPTTIAFMCSMGMYRGVITVI